ncbi:MAG: SpoIIE family protein phosphatase [Proteobacteria bacterium]|nr:SpoIIE family protein phosphatase [Pseudomonadota bacterium]
MIIQIKEKQSEDTKVVLDLLNQIETYSAKAMSLYSDMIASMEKMGISSSDKGLATTMALQLEQAKQLQIESEALLEKIEIFEKKMSDELKIELLKISRKTELYNTFNLILFLSLVTTAISLIAVIISQSIVKPLQQTFLLEKAVEQSVDGIVLFKKTGKIIFMNNAWSKMHGFQDNDDSGLHMSKFFTPERFQEKFLPLVETTHKQNAVYSEIEHLKKDGSAFPAMMAINLFTDLDNSTSLVAISRDITEKKRAEKKIEEQSIKLNIALQQAEDANKRITDSLNYASYIQRAILPDMDQIKKYIPNSFFIWSPKDIVGGDIFFISYHTEGFIISIMDCTGHGVPGAFMTMIAYSSMRSIILDNDVTHPDEILKQVNISIKSLLQKDRNDTESDDGLDAAVCFVNTKQRTLSYAGSRLPLYYTKGNTLNIIKGDKMSIGYKKSSADFSFKRHDIPIEDGASFYLATDGYVDQLGGPNRRRLGSKVFKDLLVEFNQHSFEEQGKQLLEVFSAHKMENEQQDDITIIGFQPFS